MYILKVEDTSYQIQRVNLDGTIYQVQLSFNIKDAAWYIDIFDINSNPILLSKKLQWGSLITNPYVFVSKFLDGNFYIIKTQVSDEKIGRDNFGQDKLYRLVYISNAEMREALEQLATDIANEAALEASRAKPLRFLTSEQEYFITQNFYYFTVPA